MHPFNYYDPKTVEEAVEVLKKFGDRAKCLALNLHYNYRGKLPLYRNITPPETH